MLQRLGRGVVGTKFSIEIAEDSDANGITHGSIVLERVSGGVTFKETMVLAALREDNKNSDQMRQSEQAIETEQSEDGTAPDHQSALPTQRAGDLSLTPP